MVFYGILRFVIYFKCKLHSKHPQNFMTVKIGCNFNKHWINKTYQAWDVCYLQRILHTLVPNIWCILTWFISNLVKIHPFFIQKSSMATKKCKQTPYALLFSLWRYLYSSFFSHMLSSLFTSWRIVLILCIACLVRILVHTCACLNYAIMHIILMIPNWYSR